MPRTRSHKRNDEQSTSGNTDLQNDGSEKQSNICEFVIDRTCNSKTNVYKQLPSADTPINSKESLYLVKPKDSTSSEEHAQPDLEKIDKQTVTAGVLSLKAENKTNKKLGLSSSLQDGVQEKLYITGNRKRKPAPLQSQSEIDKLLQSSVLSSDVEKMHSLPPYEVSLNQTRKQRQKERSETKGKLWFGMKAPEMTEDKKNDLTVLQMRRVLDPKHFYKNPDIRALPKFFQMGKIVEDASDFYSGRIPKKQRKNTLVDELLEDTEFRRYNKRKYMEITQTVQGSHSRKGAAKHMKRLKKGKKGKK